VLTLAPSGAAAQAGPFALGACTAANLGASGGDARSTPVSRLVPRGTRCGRLPVPLDHSGATPGRVSLNLAVVPATGQRTSTLTILTGGPGEAAVPAAAELSALLSGVRRTHDLVFVDQRGSGASDAVTCRSLETPAAVQRCAAALGPRRPFLTTKETAFDLEDVRAALALPKLSLLGISYGAKVAGEYARRFPGRTERIVLDSAAPVDGLDTSLQLRQLGLPRVLSEICEPGCERFISDPNLALSTLVRRLERRSLRGRAVLPTGRTRSARVTLDALYDLVVLSDLDPLLRLQLPGAVASGVLGDPQPLLRLLTTASQSSEGVEDTVNQARLLATSCLEGRLPWRPDSPVAGREKALVDAFNAAPAATFAPFGRETVAGASIAATCAAWPATPAPDRVPQRGPDVPVLVLAGREDLRTPLEDARRTAAQYPNATVLAVSGVGHSVLGSDATRCAVSGVTAFLAGRTVAKCTRRVNLRVAPFVPVSLDDVARQDGVPGRAGRVATAAAATLGDVSRTLLSGTLSGSEEPVTLRVPGLRGGSATIRLARRPVLRLRDYEVVRGVRLSGTVGTRTGRLVVTGPGGIAGVLRSGRNDRFRGEIGGQRVSFVVR